MFKNWFSRFLIFLLWASGLSGCISQEALTTPEAAAQNIVVEAEARVYKIGYIPVGAYAPVYLAIEKGYFAEQGLQVELESFRSGAEMIAPLSLGQLDIGAGEIGTALFNAAYEKLDVKAVLAWGYLREGHAYQSLLVRKDLYDAGEITEIADLAGKKVAINNSRGVTEYLLDQSLAHADITIDDVEVVVLPYTDMLEALTNKAIDAAMVQYPQAEVALSPGENGEPPVAAMLLPGDQITDQPEVGIMYFGKTLLDPANQDVAVKFLVAFLKAFRDLQGDAWRDDEQIVNIIAQYTGTQAQTIRESPISYYDPNGAMDAARIEDIQDYYLARGYTEYSEPLDLGQVINDTFRQAAVQELGEVTP